MRSSPIPPVGGPGCGHSTPPIHLGDRWKIWPSPERDAIPLPRSISGGRQVPPSLLCRPSPSRPFRRHCRMVPRPFPNRNGGNRARPPLLTARPGPSALPKGDAPWPNANGVEFCGGGGRRRRGCVCTSRGPARLISAACTDASRPPPQPTPVLPSCGESTEKSAPHYPRGPPPGPSAREGGRGQSTEPDQFFFTKL